MKILRAIYYTPLIAVIGLAGMLAELFGCDDFSDVCKLKLLHIACLIQGGGSKS